MHGVGAWGQGSGHQFVGGCGCVQGGSVWGVRICGVWLGMGFAEGSVAGRCKGWRVWRCEGGPMCMAACVGGIHPMSVHACALSLPHCTQIHSVLGSLYTQGALLSHTHTERALLTTQNVLCSYTVCALLTMHTHTTYAMLTTHTQSALLSHGVCFAQTHTYCVAHYTQCAWLITHCVVCSHTLLCSIHTHKESLCLAHYTRTQCPWLTTHAQTLSFAHYTQCVLCSLNRDCFVLSHT